MKERAFDFSKRSDDKDMESAIANAWAIIIDMLPEEDENKLKVEFNKYMEDCKSKGIEYLPAYLWTLQRVKVSANL
jgi:hypothetical protein